MTKKNKYFTINLWTQKFVERKNVYLSFVL